MKKFYFVLSFLLLFAVLAKSQPIEPGNQAPDFSLESTTGTIVSLADYADEKGVILIFSCNPCPYVKAYEQRMIDLHHTYAPKGFPVVFINPNDATKQPADAMSEMQKRAAESKYPFPYLADAKQEVYPLYGATKTPEVFLLRNDGNGRFTVVYTGTIDDNYQDVQAVTKRYAADAVDAVLAGDLPDPAATRAIGCGIVAKGD